MKTHIKNDLKKVYLVLEGERDSKEDYQIMMLCENEIPGVLNTHVRYIDNESHYYYDISGKTSFGIVYENKNLSENDMRTLVKDLICVTHTLQKYMLDANGLVLEPEMIFRDKDTYYFCYNPSCKRDAREEFHKLTEFFVREVDYKDEEGVRFAYTLHKATMEDNYNIEEIMKSLEPQPQTVEEVDYIETMCTELPEECVAEESHEKENFVLKIWNWAKRRYYEDEYEDL